MTKMLSLAAALAAAVVSVSLAEDQNQQNQQQSDQKTNSAQAASQVQRGQEQAGSQNMDQEFVKGAAADNLFEIRLGEFIQQRVQDPQIKQFAQMLVQDHQQAQKQLQQAAQQAQIQVSEELPPAKQAMLQEMQQKQGQDLETCFVFDQVGDHHKDLLKARYEAEKGQHQQIKQYAEQTVPTLRKHMREAEQLAERFVPGEAQQAGEHIRGAAHEGANRAGDEINRAGDRVRGSGSSSGNDNSTQGGTSR
jgi:putative membrane protein